MPLKVADVLIGSIAEKEGICAGDKIISINGNNIDDFLALHFYCSEPELDFLIERGDGNHKRVFIKQDWISKIGIEPEEYRIKRCCNKCIFCFIDQMPPNQRESLYLKDDDYLFSFIYGNYISLNNLSDDEVERIVRERISPLYISVHTTDPALRKEIMRNRRDLDILQRLRFLSENRISFHTQIVVIPEINDGEVLRKTIIDLLDPEINTLSIGLVPVGLTKFRDGLYPLRTITSNEAKSILELSREIGNRYDEKKIFPADEFYLLAGEDIPPAEFYDDFCQLENGIGMLRATLENWKKKRRKFIKSFPESSLLFVTGKLAEKYINLIVSDINRAVKEERAGTLAVENEFFGKSVTVTGLLTMEDIRKSFCQIQQLPDVIAFSSNMFNADGLTIDGFDQRDLGKILDRRIIIVDELFRDWALL